MHGGLGLGARRLFWARASWFWACTGGGLRLGVMGFGNLVLGFGVGQFGLAGWWVGFRVSVRCDGAWGVGRWHWVGCFELGGLCFGLGWLVVFGLPRKVQPIIMRWKSKTSEKTRKNTSKTHQIHLQTYRHRLFPLR